MNLPLIQHWRPGATLLHHAGGGLSQARFVAQAVALAQRLPPARHVLNLCESRQAFMLGFAAALLRGQTSLLPPNKAAATIAAIRARHGDSYVLSDDAGADVAVPAQPADEGEDWGGPPPAIDGALTAVLAYTSGSTGEPLPHARTWEALSSHAGRLSRRLGFAGAQVVATVPPQHTYGLETTVMAALAGGAASHCGRPFFPRDVALALAAVPAPRLLVTAPVHLHALVQAARQGEALPPLAGIVSATAPLAAGLAAAAEQAFGAPVHEIYGSTETGALATRRTSAGPLWLPLPDLRLGADSDGAWAAGAHLDGVMRLGDLLEVQGDGAFRLIGRGGDLIKVAGKRMSLAELNHRLLDIPGVLDGVVFLPVADGEGDGAVQRPAALVVAPALSEAQIVEALRASVDPAFLPRPLRRVPSLPRSEVGKLPRAALLELLRP